MKYPSICRRKAQARISFLAAIFCSALPLGAAETADGKFYTQLPELAPAAGRPAVEAKQPPSKPSLLNEGPAPAWIWGPDQKRKYTLRQTFPGGAKTARLRATCDNVMTLFLNGQKVAANSQWESPIEVEVGKFIKEGDNVVTADVANTDGPAGFIFKLAMTGEDGKTRYLVSDATWLAAPEDARRSSPVTVVAKLGGGPWADVFAGIASTGANREQFNLLPGFQVERLFTVPKAELGSWVCITTDDKGRLIVSDQEKEGLCRVTPPPIGSSEPTKVERLAVKMTSAQGMLYAFGSLYVAANGGPGTGLYRLRDTDGDDQFDEVVKLREIRGGGEHGPHALRLSPDGKSIYLVAGNHTRPPFEPKMSGPPQTMGGVRPAPLKAEIPTGMASRVPPNWDEDLLLPRQWDGNGHAANILAPGGWVAKTDPEGKSWEVFTSGYRNAYDFAFNADGEMFVYDSDMEWDIGMPWYVPTRVSHATSGSEFGWRSGTGRWPAYFVDSLPPLVDIGPGSPVGVEFGYSTKFPAKYQRALYLCDWTFGTMYAIHLEPAGSTYKAVKEEFLSRTPLPLTDAVVGRDGALYFTVGGRGAQSELYRVTYTGPDSTTPVELKSPESDLRSLRRRIEAYHEGTTKDPAAAAEFLTPHLGHADRFIRYAARVALERLDVRHWQDAVLNSSDPETLITGAVGLAHQADTALAPKLLAALGKLDYARLSESQQLDLLRAYELVFIRLGSPDEAARKQLGEKFEALFPAAHEMHNRELANLMVYLGSPNAAHKLVPILTRERISTEQDPGDVLRRNQGYGGSIQAMLANQPDQQQMHYAFALRNLKTGWTIDERKTYFAWFAKAHKWSGGASYKNFLLHIEQDAYDNASDVERLAVEATGIRKPYVAPELPKPQGPGRPYMADEIVSLAASGLKGRSFKNGQRAYAAARCVVCHRFAGDGGATGPDLTQLAGRFNVKDLTESLIEPSKVISDQYKASVIETTSGQIITGRIVSESKEALTVVIDPENAAKVSQLNKSEIARQTPSAVSLMPADLLKPLNEVEVLDLLAYLLSRGNPQDPLFKK